MDTTTLFLGVMFGSIGLGYFVYGKRQQKGIALAAGVALMGLPYFISSVLLLVLVSVVLAALPFFARY